MRVHVFDGYEEMCREAAAAIAQVVRRKPTAVLGLATGSSPIGVYRELIRIHNEGLSFAHVTCFNLDEYVGLAPDHAASYRRFMQENLFHGLDVPESSIYVPSGLAPDYQEHCARYERRIAECGGIDVQLLGLGADGHIGFNEPGTSLDSRCNVQTLGPQTIRDNARFFARESEVPVHAVTMGVATILEARSIIILAAGAAKAPAVAASIEGPVSSMATASALQCHPDATWLLDRQAAAGLKNLAFFEWVQGAEAKNPAAAAARLPR